MRSALPLLGFMVLLAGCARLPASSAEPAIPTAEAVAMPRLAADSSGMEMQALGHGRLALDNGCLRLASPDGSQLIVWPSTATLSEDGRTVRDASTGHGVRIGDAIVIGGGEVELLDLSRLDRPLNPRCQGPYWVAGRGFFKAPEEGWRTVRMSGPYTVKLPADMVQVPVTPIDTLVDVYQSPTLRLTFDYGALACGVRGAETPEDLRTSETRIDQRLIQMERWSEPSDHGRRVERLEAMMRDVDLPRRTAPGAGRSACLAVHAQCETGRDCDVARGIVSTLWIGPTSREEAIGRVLSEYPELEVYRSTDLPPHEIVAERSASGEWRIAFIRSGSGIHSIFAAHCFSVSRFGEIQPTGTFRRAGRNVARVDIRTCAPAP